ncbi:hypothetical protein RU07_21125 [Agrobacterium tumefaciens]|uniref:Uncharacterized protein n=1 Tax=Agrobacterium tumefaciens TaxID=358 RepID=A0A0D0KM84_AGRTU|nr:MULTISPECIES: hypothetical protein [Rhizobium]KIP99156.1 hypothetical protein RU07_21125 [Agrobacterium tumefaciens]MCI9865618.1 hypothetical protein [Rhizobium skierniewicense]
MKPILIIVATIGFSASAAMADSLLTKNVDVSFPVDREFKTASIATPTDPAEKPIKILRKTDRLPGLTETATASPQAALQRMQ